MTALESQQPGYLSHSDAAATPVDRFPYGQTLIFGHCPQRLPNPPLSVRTRASRSPSAVTRRDRWSFEPPFPVDPFFAQYGLGI